MKWFREGIAELYAKIIALSVMRSPGAEIKGYGQCTYNAMIHLINVFSYWSWGNLSAI